MTKKEKVDDLKTKKEKQFHKELKWKKGRKEGINLIGRDLSTGYDV